MKHLYKWIPCLILVEQQQQQQQQGSAETGMMTILLLLLFMCIVDLCCSSCHWHDVIIVIIFFIVIIISTLFPLLVAVLCVAVLVGTVGLLGWSSRILECHNCWVVAICHSCCHQKTLFKKTMLVL